MIAVCVVGDAVNLQPTTEVLSVEVAYNDCLNTQLAENEPSPRLCPIVRTQLLRLIHHGSTINFQSADTSCLRSVLETPKQL